MLEAFDAGLPVVASTADGCRELIEEYAGDLFPIGDIETLAAILRARVAAPRQRISYDLSPHFIENVNRTIIEVYTALIERRRQQPHE
jgi:glycosyltransferase involved in cell wall biosynthesis